MSVLFEKANIKGMELKNRLVRSATHEGMSDGDGYPTEALFKYYDKLAQGGVGLLITGYAYVSPDGISPTFGMQGILSDDYIPKYRELVEVVHGYGTPIAMQIAHCGLYSAVPQPLAPSAVVNKITGVVGQEMTEEDIERVIEAFAQAARRVKESGFDGVQIHAAHGFLINQFASLYTNKRDDRWGGSLENRLRFLREVYKRCRAQVGEDYPLLAKISAWDKTAEGLKPEDGVVMARMMAEMGFDGIEVSCGILEDVGSIAYGNGTYGAEPPQGYNRKVAQAIKSQVKVPVFVVGGLTDPAVMEEIVANGEADYISMSRGLVADPNFPKRLEEGNRKPAVCIHCNLCYGYILTEPLRCYQGKKLEGKDPIFQDILVLK